MTVGWKRRLKTMRDDASRGFGLLRAGAREARPTGAAPARDRARLFDAAALTALALGLCLAWLDAPLAAAAREADPEMRAVFRAFTDLAKSDWMLIAVGVTGSAAIPLVGVAHMRGRRRTKASLAALAGWCGFAFLAIAGSGIAVNALKIVFGRGRPRTYDLEGAFGAAPFTVSSDYASFPSGHATTAFAFAAVLALGLPRLRTGLFALAALVAMSRVVVGAHYPSDVLAGAALGVGFTHALARALHARGLVFAVRRGQWTLKAPRALRNAPRILRRAARRLIRTKRP